VAVVARRAGSLPTSGSVSRKALISPRAAGEELALLLGGAEQHERLGHPDRLVRAAEGDERLVDAAEQLDGTAVGEVRQSAPAVLHRDLHPEGAELGEALHDGLGDLRVPLDLRGVHLGRQEALQPGEELAAARLVLRRRPGVGMHQLDAEAAEEQLLGEARPLPALLARLLGDSASLPLVNLRAAHAALPVTGW
jgi:hypothetical protein